LSGGTPKISRPISSSLGSERRTTAQEKEGWPQGVYFAPDGYKLAIVVINQLPAIRETLWLRILEKGQVQQQAFKELSDLPKDERLRKNILELVGIPSELGSLSNLQELWLQNNSLNGTLPSELGSLSNLQVLYLYNNDLSGTVRFVLA